MIVLLHVKQVGLFKGKGRSSSLRFHIRQTWLIHGAATGPGAHFLVLGSPILISKLNSGFEV